MMRRGFTLIELLISIALAMVLLLIATMALMQISRVAKRDTAQRQAHDDAGIIYRTISNSIGAMYHASQMRFEADRGADLAWGTEDDRISLIWMSALRDPGEHQMEYGPAHTYDLVWNRLCWSAVGEDRGKLEYAISNPRRVSRNLELSGSSGSFVAEISTIPQVRRDRRRDLDDNDGRLVPGMTIGDLSKVALIGDGEDLEDNLELLHAASTVIVNCRIDWIDADGYVVSCERENGISIMSPTGVPVGDANQPWYNIDASSTEQIERYVIDGTYLDGRAHVAPDAIAGRDVSRERPALIRLSFEVIASSHSGRDLSNEPRFPFTFTFTAAPLLPIW